MFMLPLGTSVWNPTLAPANIYKIGPRNMPCLVPHKGLNWLQRILLITNETLVTLAELGCDPLNLSPPPIFLNFLRLSRKIGKLQDDAVSSPYDHSFQFSSFCFYRVNKFICTCSSAFSAWSLSNWSWSCSIIEFTRLDKRVAALDSFSSSLVLPDSTTSLIWFKFWKSKHPFYQCIARCYQYVHKLRPKQT